MDGKRYLSSVTSSKAAERARKRYADMLRAHRMAHVWSVAVQPCKWREGSAEHTSYALYLIPRKASPQGEGGEA